MMRFAILLGFGFMFFLLHYTGEINKYINMKYAYLSISAIVMLTLLALYEFIRGYRQDLAEERRKARLLAEREQRQEQALASASVGKLGHDHGDAHDHSHDHDHAHSNSRDHSHSHAHDHAHDHDHDHEHVHDHAHDHAHAHGHDHAHDVFGHSHEPTSAWKRVAGYAILLFPIFTGIFLPVQTLDSSFVAAKGFSFPTLDEDVKNNPGFHQFLRPDTSVFYSKKDYELVKSKEMKEFIDKPVVTLSDDNFMKGMEALYNYPSDFMGKTIEFDGFSYKGKQVDGNHYFVFRFGFIHCVADSGVFGMLVDFPANTGLENDDWVHVKGKLSWEFYQPLKATIPVLQVDSWSRIDTPKDPYVYRNF